MPKKKKNNALTLIEVLIAVAILSMVLSMVYTILISTLSARELIQEKTHVDRIANRLMTLISHDIQAAQIYSLEGTCFLGQPNRIDFISNTDSLLTDADSRSDFCEVGYFLRRNSNESGAYKLLRRQDFFIDDAPLKGGHAIKLYDRIDSFELRYIAKNSVQKKRWDSKVNKSLPIAVKITLGLRAAPRDADPAIIKKNIRYFSICVPILVSPEPPKIKAEKEQEQKKSSSQSPQPGN